MDPRPQKAMDNLRRIVQAVRQSSAQCERISGLTSAQLLLLKCVAATSGISVNELSALTLTHQSTVSEVVGRLESKGLLVRTRSAEDGRRREIELTDDGRGALKLPIVTVQETLMDAMNKLPSEDLDCLVIGLEALINAAGFAAQPPSMFMEDGLGNGQ